jgi:release factor glutamine methyltransferase
MGAFGQDLPTSFDQAIRLAQRILTRSEELVRRGVVQTESEQIVTAAFRKATGHLLSRMDLFSRLADRFPEAAGEAVIVMAGARAEGKLLQHLTGVQIFLDHEYEVGPDVLVPRPETESLVHHAIQELTTQFKAPRVGLEIGLGSGVISIELLARFDSLRMIGSELTAVATGRTLANAQRILGAGARGAGRLQIVRPETPLEIWRPFRELAGRPLAQFLISNPPYLAPADPIDQEVAEQEPRAALFPAGPDPLHFYREIAAHAAEFLEPAALIFLEIAPERSADTQALFKRHGREVRVYADLNGHDRFIEVRLG